MLGSGACYDILALPALVVFPTPQTMRRPSPFGLHGCSVLCLHGSRGLSLGQAWRLMQTCDSRHAAEQALWHAYVHVKSGQQHHDLLYEHCSTQRAMFVGIYRKQPGLLQQLRPG